MNNTTSITTDPVATAMSWLLPMEIWLMIIDELGAEREYDALEACARATEGSIQERAWRYVPDEMAFRTQEDVTSINLALRWEGPFKVRIEGGRRSGERLPIPHLATFASRLARKWTRVEILTIERAEWRVQDLDPHTVLLNLECFSISSLHLHDVTFPSILTFWRLVCALPHLKWLLLRHVDIVKTAVDARTVSALRLLSATSLKVIYMMRPDEYGVDRPGSLATHSAGLLQVILVQTLPSLKTPPWSNLWGLNLWAITLPTATAFGRLLCAFTALVSLRIDGSCTFSEHGFNPKDVHDLVDLLIQTGASECLELITAWLSPSLRELSSIDGALNRLVKHAGQSLKDLRLRALPQNSLPPHNETMMYRDTIGYFDISTNTHLERLACSLDIAHGSNSPIAPVTELLKQVAPAGITHINLSFRLTGRADPAKLYTDLLQLDAALSRNIFCKLEEVSITLHGIDRSSELRSLLPQLEARGVLRCCALNTYQDTRNVFLGCNLVVEWETDSSYIAIAFTACVREEYTPPIIQTNVSRPLAFAMAFTPASSFLLQKRQNSISCSRHLVGALVSSPQDARPHHPTTSCALHHSPTRMRPSNIICDVPVSLNYVPYVYLLIPPYTAYRRKLAYSLSRRGVSYRVDSSYPSSLLRWRARSLLPFLIGEDFWINLFRKGVGRGNNSVLPRTLHLATGPVHSTNQISLPSKPVIARVSALPRALDLLHSTKGLVETE
ncbi:predicted protein [Postia placenta Mad-698-R]|nr:predicted protein [Postia placenta Mad-698-R]